MPRANEQKIKLLVLYDILQRETDEEHPLSTNEIIERLSARGIEVSRKILPGDIELLNKYGFEILSYKKKSHYYYVAYRPFDIAELKVLIDAVQAATFISESKTEGLVNRLASMAGEKQAEKLKQNFICYDTVKKVGVRKIIDDYHFIASNGESWHTGMFYEQGCSHGRDMVPLEFNPHMFDKAEERLKNHQIYHTEVYTMKDGHIEHKGTLIARYDSRHNDFRADLGEEISRSFLSLEASLALICPDYAEELRCIVQEWGVTGEDKQGILLDDGNTHIVYDGAEYIPVACGKTSVDLHSIAVLKKMCSPAQQFVFVQDFVKRENGEYCGDIIEETADFLDAAELFEGLTGRRIEEATPANCAIQSKGEAEM